MGQADITSKGESATKYRTRAITLLCANPEISQILLSVLSQFELKPVYRKRWTT